MAMAGDGTVRRIGSLYAGGSLAGLGDGRLLGRFVDGSGSERDDSFAALVLRHGPMVLGTCRRMLGGSADADDAFQAVFLVLARKADSLRGSDDVGGWLRATAVRVGREARARRAKLRLREGAPLDASRSAAAVDPDLFDVLAALDEELERLPGRFREAIRLCELEGVPRRDAADRLGLAEGTLSSRLARGRSLLRDRLARRGLAVGLLATAMPPAARSTPLPDAALQRALGAITIGYGSGAVSEAAASLAEGVLAMLALSRWKLLARSAYALAALALGAGVAWGVGGEAEEPPLAVSKPAEPHAPWTVRGVVVDESGSVVAGASVFLNPYAWDERRGVTGPDGSFAIQADTGAARNRNLLVLADAGRKIGWNSFHHERMLYGVDQSEPTQAQVEAPVRITVAPGKEVEVLVRNTRGAPVVEATVEVVADHFPVARGKTGPQGVARLTVPAGAGVQSIAALKAGAGFATCTFGDQPSHGRGEPAPGTPAVELPRPVLLVFADPWTARFQVTDESGAPMSDVPVWVGGERYLGWRRVPIGFHRELRTAKTGQGGFVVFDWLPPNLMYASCYVESTGLIKLGSTTVTPTLPELRPIRVRPKVYGTIRGRVVLPDGSPASGISVSSRGWSPDQGEGRGSVTTDADGRYAIEVPRGSKYVVRVEHPDWVAPTRKELDVRAEEPTTGVDFQLSKGTLIRGVLTAGPDRRPEWGYVILARPLPEQPEETPRDPRDVRPQRLIPAPDGRYAFRVMPGSYALSSFAVKDEQLIEVNGQAEIVRDFHAERPWMRNLSGKVVDDQGRPVANARVVVEGNSGVEGYWTRTADADGRFTLDCRSLTLTVAAYSPDDGLAGCVDAAPDDREVLVRLAPSARVTGVLVDAKGKPRSRQPMFWMYLTQSMLVEAPMPTDDSAEYDTDDQGRFVSPPLIVGQKYRGQLIPRDVPSPPLGWFPVDDYEVEKPGLRDLGEIRVEARGNAPQNR